SGNPNFGRKCTATIIRNGDLAFRVYLYVHLEAVKLNANDNQNTACVSQPKVLCGSASVEYTPPMFAWVRRLGHAIIKNVKIDIGGSEIDKQYATWLDIWYNLTHEENQERGYRNMIGDVDELTRLDAPASDGTVKNPYRLFIPLQFWFNRN